MVKQVYRDMNIYRMDSKKGAIIFLVAFREVNDELRENLCESINADLIKSGVDPLGESLNVDLEYRFENNTWTGLTLPYTNTETGRVVSVLLINMEKVKSFGNIRSSPKYFLMNILSHELRHLVDYVMLEREGSISEVEEEPAYLTGSLMEESMPILEKYLENMK